MSAENSPGWQTGADEDFDFDITGSDVESTIPVANPLARKTMSGLLDNHVKELITESAIDPEVITERGYRTMSRPTKNDQGPREELRKLGIPTWAIREDTYFPGLLIPMWRATGERITCQFKPYKEVPNRDGKKMKYASPKGQAMRIDVHPRWSKDRGAEDAALLPYIQDVKTPLYITEGVKTADSLTSQGLCTVALLGVYNWRNTHATLGDWEDIPLKGREVTIVFDADAHEKRAVLQAMQRLGQWLDSKGAERVHYLITPPRTPRGALVKGADDFLAAGGTKEELLAARTTTRPREPITEDRFTDSKVAEYVTGDALTGNYLRVRNLGWFRWADTHWQAADTSEVKEAIRRYLGERYASALHDAGNRSKMQKTVDETECEGWRRYQSNRNIENVLDLVGGIADIYLDDAAKLDANPDLLNTPDGVLDLSTGDMLEHSPDRLITMITKVGYRENTTSEAFKSALGAVPEDTREFLRKRLGQAITGYMPDDERAMFLIGGGKNGKTTLMNALYESLGSYAKAITNKLLINDKASGSATPEKMSIRGVRLAYIEETPERKYLDTQALKEIVGTPTITGRELYKGFVTFGATHSIVLNTNHPPMIAETDGGTWRRIVRVNFPYRFREAGQALETELDRYGDPRLKTKLTTTEALEAALAWMVTGAHDWYANDKALPSPANDPRSVVEATDNWRKESDRILNFWDSCLWPDRGSCVSAKQLHIRFNDYIGDNGHKPWTLENFNAAFRTHTETAKHGVADKRIRTENTPITWATAWDGTPLPMSPLPKQLGVWVGVRYRLDADDDRPDQG